MTAAFELSWLSALLLATVRLGPLFMFSPILSGLGNLVTVRVLLSFALSACLLAGGVVRLERVPVTLEGLLLAAGAELLVGGLLGLGVLVAFAAFSLGGKLLDVQTGLGLGSVYDPVNRAGSPVFATLLNMLGVIVFFGMEAHHALLRGLAYSFERVPLGGALSALSADALVVHVGLMFTLAVVLVAPVLVCLLLVEVGLAVLSRALPQMNVFIVLMPVKIVAGLAMLAFVVPWLGPSMSRVYGAIFTFWERGLG
jgi:flagellar biosynthetic protein FliR